MNYDIGFDVYENCKEPVKQKKVIESARIGIFGALIGTYLADVVRNVFVDNQKDLKNIITKVSPIDFYIGSVSGGAAGGAVGRYLDPITTSSVSVGTNRIATNYASKSLNKNSLDDYELAETIIFDNIAIGIIIYVFGAEMLSKEKDMAQKNIFNEQLLIFFVLNLYFIVKAPFFLQDLID